jgi:hypothetical protein
MKNVVIGLIMLVVGVSVLMQCSKSRSTAPDPCSFAVTTPASGAGLTRGSTQTIQWTSTGAGANAKLELYKGSILKCAIVASTANNGSYSWTVDDCGGGTGSDYSIRVSDAANAACKAVSAAFTITVPCTFAITSPTSGASLTKRSTQTIQWTSTGAGTNAKLELYKGSILKCAIVASTTNNGSYFWTVDDCGGGTGSDYSIKVSDAANAACNASSTAFAITVPCIFAVSSPASGANLTKGSTQTVQWTSSGAGANAKLELYEGSTQKCVIAASTANNGSYSWTVDDCSGGTAADYSIHVSDVGNATCGANSGTFGITVPCTFAMTSPASGATWTKGSTQTIQWTTAGAGTNAKLELYKGSALQCAIVASTTNNGSYSWTVDDCSGGTGSDYRIKVSDAANAACSALSGDFAITIPCSIQITSPSVSSVWPKGSTQPLYWTTSGASDSVKIDLYKGSSFVYTLASSFNNSGSASWTMVDDYGSGEGSDYRIKITDVKSAACYGFSDYFTITVPCAISISSPSSYSVWARGSSQQLAWTTSGYGDSVRIDLYKGIQLVATLAASFYNSGTANWQQVNDYGGGAGTDYRIKISDLKKPSCYGFSDYFMIYMSCTFTITSPGAGAVWTKGSSQTIRWTPSSGIAHVKLQLFKGGTSLNCVIVSSVANYGSYSWVVDDCGGGTGSDYWLKISDADYDTCNGFGEHFSITAASIIEQSTITSSFNGFNYGNEYEFANGHIWQQTEYYYTYHYAYRPAVTVTLEGGSYKMKVDGIDRAVTVVRIY